MMRAMYSGVSGLKAHQTKMDVIGNNISNVNTVGFKASSVNFSDVFYQTMQGASGANAETGAAGQNALQVGIGVDVASITSSVAKQGSSQRTDNPFDVMIEGDGFFIVNSGGQNYFTKAGSFNVDSAGNLCTPAGAKVMGWQVDPKDSKKTVSETVSPLTIMKPENMYSKPEATTAAYITGNIDSKDTQLNGTGRMANISFYDSTGQKYSLALKVYRDPADAGSTDGATNKYKVSVVDVTDSNGDSIFVKKKSDNTYEATSIKSFKFGGTDFNVTVDTSTGKVTNASTSALSFNATTGKFESIVGSGTTASTDKNALGFEVISTNGPFKAINIDFSTMTQFASSGTSAPKGYNGDLNGLNTGRKKGNMTGVGIDSSGKINATYDNGDSRLLGQIAVAAFANPAGLEAVGDNMFTTTMNSGDFDGIGQDPSLNGGSLSTGVLEMSNVDLAAQFTDMITTQRGFQANSRIITTSDTFLEELINLKR